MLYIGDGTQLEWAFPWLTDSLSGRALGVALLLGLSWTFGC